MFGINFKRQRRMIVGQQLAGVYAGASPQRSIMPVGRNRARVGQCPPGYQMDVAAETCVPSPGGYGGKVMGWPGYPQGCGWPTQPCNTCHQEFVSGSISVPANSTVTLQLTTNVPFCLYAIKVPGSIGPFFDINSITVGNVPQTAGSGPTSAEIFAPDATDVTLKGSCVYPAVPIEISVTNKTNVDRTFQITAFGNAID